MRKPTEQELECAAGGAASIAHFDSNGTLDKITGSANHGNPGSVFGGNGSVNIQDHITNFNANG
jgi:hypothetical protein